MYIISSPEQQLLVIPDESPRINEWLPPKLPPGWFISYVPTLMPNTPEKILYIGKEVNNVD